MKLNELLYEADVTKGPGDYLPGDEDIPGSPDYDPSRHYRSRVRTGPKRFTNPEDDEWNRRLSNAARFTIKGELAGETADPHYPHKIIIHITGPSKSIDNYVNKFIGHESNNYQQFDNVEKKNLDDNISVATISMHATPQSLWYHKVSTENV